MSGPTSKGFERVNRADEKRRLQNAGLWDAFVAEKERLKADGVSAPKAREQALELVLGDAECPGAERSHATTYSLPSAVPRGSQPQRKSVEWVAENLSVQNVNVEDAPCSEAVALLNWASSGRQALSAFWSIWSKLLPTKAQIEADAEPDRQKMDRDRILALLDSVEIGTGRADGP